MAFQNKKFLDAAGITHLVGLLDEYPNNQVLGTVIDAIEGELEEKADKTDTVLNTTLSLGRLANSDVGENSVALGYDVTASGDYSFATGSETIASSDSAHAEGENTQATDSAAHAEGTYTEANGYASHAEGDSSIANGWFAHAEGSETTASGRSTHVFGERNYNNNQYPSEDNEQRGTMVEIVGNGQGNGYSNARALTWTGDEYLAGNLYVNANATSTSGTRVAMITEIPEVPVQDVQVNGTSVLTTGTANIPVASYNNHGVIQLNDVYGLALNANGVAYINSSIITGIKAGTDTYRPIVPGHQHESVFYGLAKAAGDTTMATSSNAVGTYTDSAKASIKNMLGITQTLTVTVLTQDNVTVTGQTVTVRAVDSTGPTFATAAYEGQPVAFSVPSGFAYHVSVSDTLDHHFNPTTASGIVTNTDIAVTLQYSDFSTIRTAADIKAALNANMDLTDLVGEQITCSKGNSTLAWDVVDYDTTNGSITLLLHDAFGTANMVFEPVQALMWCENGLAAGAYTFADGGTHYYFTLTNAIPAGGQLRADPSSFWTYASQDATATLETGTVSTTEITGATDLGTCGQGLLNNFTRNRYGSNNQAESAIQWWLNSDAPANTLRTPVTKFSRAYSYNVPGFMNGLDQDFISCLDDVDWLCSTNNVYECPEELGGYTKGIRQTYTIKSKFCFASEMEIFGSYGGNPDESTVFDLYNGADADDRKKYRGTSAQTWWLRSPLWSGAYYERNVHSSGSVYNGYATNSYAVVPACRISRDSEVTE